MLETYHSNRLAKKARISIQDNLAEALLRTWAYLKTVASDDFQDDDEIKVSKVLLSILF